MGREDSRISNWEITDLDIIPAGGGRVWRGAGLLTAGEATGLLLVVVTDSSNTKLHRVLKHGAFQVLCRERLHCSNAFRVGSSNSSFTTKSLRMLIYRIPNKYVDSSFSNRLRR